MNFGRLFLYLYSPYSVFIRCYYAIELRFERTAKLMPHSYAIRSAKIDKHHKCKHFYPEINNEPLKTSKFKRPKYVYST